MNNAILRRMSVLAGATALALSLAPPASAIWPTPGDLYQIESLDPLFPRQCVRMADDRPGTINLVPCNQSFKPQQWQRLDGTDLTRLKNKATGKCAVLIHDSLVGAIFGVLGRKCGALPAYEKWGYDDATMHIIFTDSGSSLCWTVLNGTITAAACITPSLPAQQFRINTITA
ncbi:hypothetical protein JMUB6875_62320 [Nocardia sp. JMUB6875]|uniref:hypothetical protein n=1 Tax=Nocardia sp. JMUB6875 TaxID=3158170 RepID=UPI0032E7EE89